MAEEVKELEMPHQAHGLDGAQQIAERAAMAEIESIQKTIGLANPAPGQYAKALEAYATMLQAILDRHTAQGAPAPKSYGQALESAKRAARYNVTIAAKSRAAIKAIPVARLPVRGPLKPTIAPHAACGCGGAAGEFKSPAP